MARSKQEIRDALDQMRRAADELSTKPERRREAETHTRVLEHLLVHGETHKGNPNLSANAIVRNARAFLFEWEDHGFAQDEAAPDSE
jgi:hypothetical protein